MHPYLLPLLHYIINLIWLLLDLHSFLLSKSSVCATALLPSLRIHVSGWQDLFLLYVLPECRFVLFRLSRIFFWLVLTLIVFFLVRVCYSPKLVGYMLLSYTVFLLHPLIIIARLTLLCNNRLNWIYYGSFCYMALFIHCYQNFLPMRLIHT